MNFRCSITTSTMHETTTMLKSASPIVSPHGVEILAAGRSANLIGNLVIGVVAVVTL
jgi:hypothetical protein